MKIRTITFMTSFYKYDDSLITALEKGAAFCKKARETFVSRGFEVQQMRMATNSWAEFFSKVDCTEVALHLRKMETAAMKAGLSSISAGPCTEPGDMILIPDLIKGTDITYFSSIIATKAEGINIEACRTSASVVMRLAHETPKGYGNFRFAALACPRAGIAFFPAAHSDGKTSFSIGLECSDLLAGAVASPSDYAEFGKNLEKILLEKLKKVEEVCIEIEKHAGIPFEGIDASIAPSLSPEDSISGTYKKLGIQRLGAPGSIFISSAITKAIKNCGIKKCGYSGLMLPVCEDAGIAADANTGKLSLSDLLVNSSVCGTGLDTVPIPGDVSENTLLRIMLDVGALATRLDKPLGARLMPIPGKKKGERSEFDSEFLINCNILDVE